MIVTEGGRFGGYGLFLSKGELGIGRGKVVFLYNLLGLKRTAWEGPELKPGKHTILFDFIFDGTGFGKGGTGTLIVDGNIAATKSLENTTPIMFPEDETLTSGMDTRTPFRSSNTTTTALQVHRQDQQADLHPRAGAIHGRGAQAAAGDPRSGRSPKRLEGYRRDEDAA